MQDFFNKIIKKIKLGYKIEGQLLKRKQYIIIYGKFVTDCNVDIKDKTNIPTPH